MRTAVPVAPLAIQGFWSSFQFSTLIAGQLVSVAVLLVLQAFLSRPQLEAYGIFELQVLEEIAEA